jgi:hypothetical protein
LPGGGVTHVSGTKCHLCLRTLMRKSGDPERMGR